MKRRKTGGRQKGTPNKKTESKEQAREALRQIVIGEMHALVDAQLANAKGIKYLVVREKKSGKFIRVTEAMARQKQELTDNEEIIEVWEKDPSVQAFTDLMNRAIDKPKEQEQDVDLKAEIVIRWQ
jgi:hypothetical protein